MQQELQFYRKQAVDAMQARDRANADAEQLRARSNTLDATASTCQADLKATQHSYDEAQQRLKDQEQEITDLRRRVEDAAQVPTLQLQVERLQEALDAEWFASTKVEVCRFMKDCRSMCLYKLRGQTWQPVCCAYQGALACSGDVYIVVGTHQLLCVTSGHDYARCPLCSVVIRN